MYFVAFDVSLLQCNFVTKLLKKWGSRRIEIHTHTHTQGKVPPTDTKLPPLGSDMAPMAPLTAGVPVLPGIQPEVCVHAEGVSSEGVWWSVCEEGCVWWGVLVSPPDPPSTLQGVWVQDGVRKKVCVYMFVCLVCMYIERWCKCMCGGGCVGVWEYIRLVT